MFQRDVVALHGMTDTETSHQFCLIYLRGAEHPIFTQWISFFPFLYDSDCVFGTVG